MIRHRLVPVLLAASAAAPFAAGSAEAAGRPSARLQAFGSCASLLSYARHNAMRTGGTDGVPTRAIGIQPPALAAPALAPGMTGITAAPDTATVAPTAGDVSAVPDHSSTNVQEPGIDEPDVVKTDGRRLWAIANGTLYAFDVSSGTPKLRGSLKLEGSAQQLLVRGDHALVMATLARVYAVPLQSPGAPVPGIVAPPIDQTPQVILTEVDLSDPAHLAVRRTETLDGTFVDARLSAQGTARVVVASAPRVLTPVAIARSGVRTWVPRTVFRSRVSGRTLRRAVAPCTSVRRPPAFSGLDLLTVLTIDLDKGLYSLDRDGILAGAQTVYGSAGSVYVASQRYDRGLEEGRAVPAGTTTEIHRFDISDPEKTTYAASGVVPGSVLNQYSLSEYDGDLRVASTQTPVWFPDGGPASTAGQSYVTVLRQQGSVLRRVGQVGGIGKGERIYAVRFLGDQGFVVTFRQVDPLYTLDLSDPADPKVRGELDLLGYSAYLHPVGDGRLLGVGQDVSAQGRPGGVQLSLFDVSDLSRPTRLAQVALGDGSSTAAEFDPHAFLFWKPTSLAVLPVQQYGGSGGGFSGVVGVRVSTSTLTPAGSAQQPATDGYAPPIERSVVVGDHLFTLSYAGIGTSRLDTLAPIAFTAYGG